MDTIYIAFTHSNKWQKHFLKKGFAHCLVLIAMQNGWLEIDPTAGIMQFHARTDSQIAHYHKLLRVTISGYKFKGIPLKFFTCVTMIEYMLGKSIHAITPYRLYKKLTGKFKKTFNTKEII